MKMEKERNLLWSLHIRTTYFPWPLKILKKTAVYSSRLFELKTSNPNGPKAPLTDAPFWLQSNCGLVQLGSRTSAFSKSDILNDTSISACQTEATIFSAFSIVGEQSWDKIIIWKDSKLFVHNFIINILHMYIYNQSQGQISITNIYISGFIW